jgi:hypothetical protein
MFGLAGLNGGLLVLLVPGSSLILPLLGVAEKEKLGLLQTG